MYSQTGLDIVYAFIKETIPKADLADFLKFLKTRSLSELLPNSDIDMIPDRTAEIITNIKSDELIDKLIGIVQIIQEGKDIYAAIMGIEEESPFEVNEYKIILDTARYAWDSFSESYNRQVNGYDYIHVIPEEEKSEEDESNEEKEEKRYRYVEDEMSM